MTKFFVNEDKKAVVCLITITRHKGLPNQTFIGKAKCSPSDTFDVEKGKDIAYVRALLKLKKAEVQYHKSLTGYYKSCQISHRLIMNIYGVSHRL